MSDSLEVPLRRVSTIIMGQSPPSDTYNSDGRGLPFLQGNADFGRKTPSPTTYSTAPRKVSNPGDVLLSVRAPVGQLNVSDQRYGLGRGLCAVRFRPGLADPALGWYAMLASAWRLQQVATGSTYDSVDYQDVASVRIPVIDRAKQATVADFLDRETAHIDGLIGRKERLIALLEEKRCALITRAVTKGVDPDVPMKDSGVEWIGEIPEHWEVAPLKRVTRCLDSQRVPLNAEERADMKGPYPYWGANGIVDHIDRWIFDEQLVLLGEDGAPFFDRLKDVAFVATGKIWVNNHIHVLRPRQGIDARYLAAALNATEYVAFIEGSTRDKLTQAEMKQIPIPVPPSREQEAIGRSLSEVDAVTLGVQGRLKQSISFLEERRSALITAAVTGHIDVDEYERSYRAPLSPDDADLEASALTASAATPDA